MVSSDTQAQMMFEARKKSVFVTYLLWFFLSVLGLHRFYVHKYFSGLIQLALGVAGMMALFSGAALALSGMDDGSTVGFGMLALLLWACWILLDALIIPRWVRKYNVGLVEKLSG